MSVSIVFDLWGPPSLVHQVRFYVLFLVEYVYIYIYTRGAKLRLLRWGDGVGLITIKYTCVQL